MNVRCWHWALSSCYVRQWREAKKYHSNNHSFFIPGQSPRYPEIKVSKSTSHLTLSPQTGRRLLVVRWRVKRVNVRHCFPLHPHSSPFILALFCWLSCCPSSAKALGLCGESWPRGPAVCVTLMHRHTELSVHFPSNCCVVPHSSFKRAAARHWPRSIDFIPNIGLKIQWISICTCNLTLNIIEATR